jgi:hypothetical protein
MTDTMTDSRVSMDTLTAMNVGDAITVNQTAGQVVWHKTEMDPPRWRSQVMSSSSGSIAQDSFVGYLRDGLVEVGARTLPEIRTMWVYDGFYYLVLDRTDTVVKVLTLASDLAIANPGVSTRTLAQTSNWTPVLAGNQPEWLRPMVALGQMVMSRNERIEALGQRTLMPAGFLDSIREFIDDGGNSLDEFEDEVLDPYGLARTSDIDVEVGITGVSVFTEAEDIEAGSLFGDEQYEFNAESPTVRIPWTRTVQITKTGRGCQCQEITYDDVRPYLPDNGETEEWDYETQSCEACG